MSTKLKQIKQQIKVKEAWLSEKGLEFLYSFNGQERFISLCPEAAAELLEQFTIVELVSTDDNGNVVLEYTPVPEYADDPQTVRTDWKTFAEDYYLSQWDAITLIADIEYDRLLDEKIYKL